MAMLLLWILFFLFLFGICHAFLSVYCSLVVTCRERANLLVPVYVMFSCVFVTFSSSVLGQVSWVLDCIDSRSLPSYLLL